MSHPALIALDWGTSALRAYALGADGETQRTASSSDGLAAVHEGGPDAFERALRGLLDGWVCGEAPLLAAGMVGSRQGWVEAPYVPVPADLTALADRMAVVRRGDGDLRVVPGMVDTGALPSVMRGEETQLVGVLPDEVWAGATAAERLVVLPGTHTKWVRLRGREVRSIATAMTGELYGLLCRHGILATTLRTGGEAHPEVFRAAVRLARDSGLGASSTIFSTRSLGLLDRLTPDEQAEHLSGLLVGHELVDHERTGDDPAGWTLAGDPALCERYRQAALELGWPEPRTCADAAPRGLWRLALAAGLVRPVTTGARP